MLWGTNAVEVQGDDFVMSLLQFSLTLTFIIFLAPALLQLESQVLCLPILILLAK